MDTFLIIVISALMGYTEATGEQPPQYYLSGMERRKKECSPMGRRIGCERKHFEESLLPWMECRGNSDFIRQQTETEKGGEI